MTYSTKRIIQFRNSHTNYSFGRQIAMVATAVKLICFWQLLYSRYILTQKLKVNHLHFCQDDQLFPTMISPHHTLESQGQKWTSGFVRWAMESKLYIHQPQINSLLSMWLSVFKLSACKFLLLEKSENNSTYIIKYCNTVLMMMPGTLYGLNSYFCLSVR